MGFSRNPLREKERKHMQYYLKSAEESMTQLKSQKEGLSETEAKTRMEACGKNKLQEAERESLMHRFFVQMEDPMILILIAAELRFMQERALPM